MAEETNKTEEVKEEVKTAENAEQVLAAEKKKSKKVKRQILKGRAVIKCSYNNTIVSIADINGNVLAWGSSGL